MDKTKINSTICANCGGIILPGEQVGVMQTGGAEPVICHTTLECSPAGNTHYGIWGNGRLLSSFDDIEQC